MRKLLFALAVGVVLGLGVVFVRAARFSSRQLQVAPAAAIRLEARPLAARLGAAVRRRTISPPDSAHFDPRPFLDFHRFLSASFPRVHRRLRREVVGGYSLLYTWEGTRRQRKPILLLGHLDVVPAGREEDWTYAPFSGRVAAGYIWGRGAMDDKVSVMGLLEAVEYLLKEGFQPRRTLYLAFGHDEEVGGLGGAAKMAALLKERGVELEYALDEGGLIARGLLPGVETPVALVGIAEKGYLSVELKVRGEGGHSSMPPPHTAIGILSTAIHRLERRPFPARIGAATRALLEYVGPEMSFARKLVFANMWLFGGLVERWLAAAPTTNALIRTTAAATLFKAGVRENVLPAEARAVVNFRLLPGDSVQEVLEHVRRAIDDERVQVLPREKILFEPAAVSHTEAAGFATLQEAIRQVMPAVVVAPWLLVGATDSRHYAGLCEEIYRFVPMGLGPGDAGRIHGLDERLAVADYVQGVRFFVQFIRRATR